MGASISKNISNVITHSVATTTSRILHNVTITTDQSNIIYVSDVTGDVDITGNNIQQNVHVNTQALMSNLTNSYTQESINQNIAQAAKALISGLNFAQLADANNLLKSTIETCIEVKNTALQTCSTTLSQDNIISINHINGVVNIKDNDIRQIVELFSDCIQKAVNESSSVNDITQKLSQVSSTSVKGLSFFTILIIIAAIVVGGIGGTVILGKELIFPAILIASVVNFALYFEWTSKNVYSYAYEQNLISNEPCSSSLLSESQYNSPTEASEECKKNTSCVAYEWQNDKSTKFFSKVSPDCQAIFGHTKDHYPIIPGRVGRRVPLYNTIPEDAKINEVIFTTDGNIHAWSKEEWKIIGNITELEQKAYQTRGADIYFEPVSNAGEDSVFIDLRDETNLRVYTMKNRIWTLQETFPGPGIIVDVPFYNNTIGFASYDKKLWLLFLGILLLIIGIVGLVITNKSKNK
ncbi:hypothetical protein AGMMS49579_15230 [Spirochaetia bacterium]|nr:hypothetical protein AGMMS49579_15230 [Spirochaetia bacterium]